MEEEEERVCVRFGNKKTQNLPKRYASQNHLFYTQIKYNAFTFRKEYKYKMRLFNIVIVMDGKSAR